MLTENQIAAMAVGLIGGLIGAASPFIAFWLYDKYRKPKVLEEMQKKINSSLSH